MVDIAKLKLLAEEAGPYPWFLEAPEDFSPDRDKWAIRDKDGVIAYERGVLEAEYVRFMAAANPDAVLKLIGENERLRAAFEELLDALRQIAEWPDGGNLYGQEKIKRFAQHAIDAAVREENKA